MPARRAALTVGSSTTASSVARRRLTSSRSRAASSKFRSAAASRIRVSRSDEHRLEIVADRDDVVGHAAVADLDQHMVALVDAVHDVADRLLDALRRDAVGGVVLDLLLAAAVGLGDGALHRAGHLVGIEDHLAVDVARGAADGLDQRGLAAQKAFLVGVEDRDQRAFGNVEALAQQVDADQRVERAEAQDRG